MRSPLDRAEKVMLVALIVGAVALLAWSYVIFWG